LTLSPATKSNTTQVRIFLQKPPIPLALLSIYICGAGVLQKIYAMSGKVTPAPSDASTNGSCGTNGACGSSGACGTNGACDAVNPASGKVPISAKAGSVIEVPQFLNRFFDVLI
jgi:hypothetical protein